VLLGTVGMYYGNRGGLAVAGLVLYALTAGVAGFTSSCLYKYLGGDKWAWNIIVAASVFSGPLFVI